MIRIVKKKIKMHFTYHKIHHLKVYNSEVFLNIHKSAILTAKCRNFHYPPKETLYRLAVSPLWFLSSSRPWRVWTYFLFLWICLFWEDFHVWLHSLSITFSRLTRHSVYQYFIPFYCWVILHCTDVPCFVHSFIGDGHLGYFHFSAIMNNAAVNIFLQLIV